MGTDFFSPDKTSFCILLNRYPLRWPLLIPSRLAIDFRLSSCYLISMEVVFSKHAMQQLQERNLSRAEVSLTVRRPQKIIEQVSGRFQAVRALYRQGKRYLLVAVYEKNNAHATVVTAFLTTKFKKFL